MISGLDLKYLKGERWVMLAGQAADLPAATNLLLTVPPAADQRQTLEARHRLCNRTQREPALIEARRPDHLATMERVSPPCPTSNDLEQVV